MNAIFEMEEGLVCFRAENKEDRKQLQELVELARARKDMITKSSSKGSQLKVWTTVKNLNRLKRMVREDRARGIVG